jgi:hypothetical protein
MLPPGNSAANACKNLAARRCVNKGDRSMSTWKEWLTKRGLHELLPLPDAVLDREWQPSDADRAAAWDLYTELRTRVTTQPLHYRAGDEEAALDSLFKLFGLTRDLLHKYQRQCSHFAILSVFMLNGVLRPFTARWHKVKGTGRLANEDGRRDFRHALILLQQKLIPFQRLLGQLAEDENFKEKSETPEIAPYATVFSLGNDIASHNLLGNVDANIWECEKADIVRHRQVVLEQKDAKAVDLVGLAISGGGIRSATFALGVVQRLAEQGFLAEVDYLSTVSGGGYLGSFLSSYLNSNDANVGSKPEQLPFKPVNNNEAPPIRHLRNHSKYLIEGTWFNHLTSVGQAAYGVLTNLLILFPFIVLLATLTACLKGDTIHDSMTSKLSFDLHWFTIGIIGVMAITAIGLGVVQNLSRNGPYWKKICECYEKFAAFTLLITAVTIAFDLAPAVFTGYDHVLNKLPTWLNMSLGLATPTTIGALVVAVKRYPAWSQWLMRLFWLSGPLGMIFFYLSLTHLLISIWKEARPAIDLWQTPIPFGTFGAVPWWILFLVAVGTIAYCFLCLNINMTSPHCFYREQLCSVYLLQPGPTSEPTANDELKLSELGASAKAPYHLVNGTLNLSTSKRADLRGRDSDFFLFSKHYCGSPILGYFPTKDWEALDGHVNLGTAMAISGAAAAPIMGMGSIFGASFMLTILNVRLAYWLRWKTSRSTNCCAAAASSSSPSTVNAIPP